MEQANQEDHPRAGKTSNENILETYLGWKRRASDFVGIIVLMFGVQTIVTKKAAPMKEIWVIIVGTRPKEGFFFDMKWMK